MSNLIDLASDWAMKIMDVLGYWGLAFLVALENVFPPIPSEVILPLAGFNSSKGDMNIFIAIAFATIGSVVGAMVLYYVGYWFGEERVRAIVRNWGKWLGFKETDIDYADRWFDRYGGWAVMLCRMIPIVRSLISIPAGLRKMPLHTFLLFTAIGSATWNTLLIFAGYTLGNQWDQVEKYVEYFKYVIALLILAGIALWVWHRIIKKVPAAQ